MPHTRRLPLSSPFARVELILTGSAVVVMGVGYAIKL